MEKTKIMIVEDEAISAMILETHLIKWGYEVIGPISSGTEAIATALEKKPHLILMDIMLDDEIDGIEATIEIHKSLNVPIIFLTASEDNKTYTRVQESNFSGMISKPFLFSKLKEMIAPFVKNTMSK